MKGYGPDKDLKDWTFEELTNYNSGCALDQFLVKGGEGLRSAIWQTQMLTIDWRREKDKVEKTK